MMLVSLKNKLEIDRSKSAPQHCTALHCTAMQCNAMQCNAALSIKKGIYKGPRHESPDRNAWHYIIIVITLNVYRASINN